MCAGRFLDIGSSLAQHSERNQAAIPSWPHGAKEACQNHGRFPKTGASPSLLAMNCSGRFVLHGRRSARVKNPEEIPAGRLIDELGLKNACVGDACVSDVHANFIINRGHARARDITILIDMIRKEAMENRGIDLKSEAQVIGDREPQF